MMNDIGFESSSIRQMLLKVTGIDILSIKNHEENELNQGGDQLILIHFISTTWKGISNDY